MVIATSLSANSAFGNQLVCPSHLIVAPFTQPFSRTNGVGHLHASAQPPCPFQTAEPLFCQGHPFPRINAFSRCGSSRRARQDAFEMALTQNNHVIQTLPPVWSGSVVRHTDSAKVIAAARWPANEMPLSKWCLDRAADIEAPHSIRTPLQAAMQPKPPSDVL